MDVSVWLHPKRRRFLEQELQSELNEPRRVQRWLFTIPEVIALFAVQHECIWWAKLHTIGIFAVLKNSVRNCSPNLFSSGRSLRWS